MGFLKKMFGGEDAPAGPTGTATTPVNNRDPDVMIKRLYDVHPGVAMVERPPLEAQPREIRRDGRPGMVGDNGDRDGMGARPGRSRPGTTVCSCPTLAVHRAPHSDAASVLAFVQVSGR